MTDQKTPLSERDWPDEYLEPGCPLLRAEIAALEVKLAEAEKPWDNHKTFRDVAEQQIEKQTGYYPEDTVKGLQDVIERMEMVASTECWRIQEKLQVTERETRAETFEYVRQVWASKIAALERELAEACEASGIAGVDEPMTLTEIVIALREDKEAAERELAEAEGALSQSGLMRGGLKKKLQAAERERDEWRHQARDTENALAEAQTEIDRLKQRNKELLNLIEDHEGYGESLRNQLSKK